MLWIYKQTVFWLLYIIFVLTCSGIDEFHGHGYIIFYILFECLNTRVLQMAIIYLLSLWMNQYRLSWYWWPLLICRNTQQSLLGFTNRNFGKDIGFCVSMKDEREEFEKKLSNEYEPLFIPKGLWPFNRHVFIQYAIFWPIIIFSFNKYLFSQ